MNASPSKIKNVIRVFSEEQIPENMLETVQRIKAEYRAKHPIEVVEPEPIVISRSARPEFMEPISPGGMSSPKDSMKMIMEYEKKNMEEYLQWENQQPSTWLKQLDVFENQRSKITKKGKLSANDFEELDDLDEKIKYCEDVLAELEDNYFEDSE